MSRNSLNSGDCVTALSLCLTRPQAGNARPLQGLKRPLAWGCPLCGGEEAAEEVERACADARCERMAVLVLVSLMVWLAVVGGCGGVVGRRGAS